MSVPTETRERRLTRSDLLRRAGVAAAAVAVGGATPSFAFAGPLRYQGRWLAGELSVAQWAHFVPRYNAWFRTWADGGPARPVYRVLQPMARRRTDTRAHRRASSERVS